MSGSPTLTALFVGLLASSSLVVGGVVGALWDPPGRLVAISLAFASGVVFSGVGMLAGAAVFVITDSLLDKYIEGAADGVSGFAILA